MRASGVKPLASLLRCLGNSSSSSSAATCSGAALRASICSDDQAGSSAPSAPWPPRAWSRHLHTSPAAGLGAQALSAVAAAPAENILMVLSPAQLGVQALEAVHNSTGLPWWLSIPLTTLALRGLLLPLSLRAKAGSSSLLMLDAAFEQSGAILRRITPPPTYAEGASGSAVASPPPPPPLGRLQLVRFSHSYLRKKSGGPGMGWYVGNAALQAPALVTVTMGLKQMSALVWAGLNTQGPPFFTDLTAPPVVWATMATPYGTAGAIVPLLVAFSYFSLLDHTAAARSRKMLAPLQALVLPYYVLSLSQPFAVIMSWLAHTLASHGLQLATSRAGAAAKLGVPPLLVDANTAVTEEERTTLIAAQDAALALDADPAFWRALGEKLASRGAAAASVDACRRRVAELEAEQPAAAAAAANAGP